MTDIDLGALGLHVHNLLGTYAEHAGNRDANAVAALFDYATVEFAGTALRGRDAISAHYTALLATAPPSRHLLTNTIIDVTGPDQAAARCRYSRWSIDPDATLLAIGDYRATFIHDHNEWRFASFAVARAWQLPTPTYSTTN
ncbi:nuclear transport factor 2 family protein [Rhodococcus sp. NPDC056960]|uniref:nuclear transport factor 2 family protein n=1 Tax=Rhodococcus sp. NPDC056960 TaxID=3345982 RepID=UPI003638A958